MTEEKIKEIITWLTKYKDETNCKGVVIGLSGGKDSTVAAMLAKEVWKDNVIAVMMPNGNNVDDAINELTQTENIAKTLDIKHCALDIAPIFNIVTTKVDSLFHTDNAKAKTNVPPRIRMTILYYIAQSMGYRVLGTGNKSEQYIGWTTKWGDSAYDINPLAHLTCSEVIDIGITLADKYGLDIKYIKKPPSDGLTGKTDEENFGFTYDDIDNCIAERYNDIPKEKLELILSMHKNSAHKRHMPYTIKPNFN